MYRIFTERTNVNGIKQILITLGIDFTMFEAEGCWKGNPEPSTVIETLTTDLGILKHAAECFGVLNTQSEVYIQYVPSSLHIYDVIEDKWTESSTQSASTSTEDKSMCSEKQPYQMMTEKE